MPAKYKIVMIRHGESEWNQKNLFCGWYDADLSDKGKFLFNSLLNKFCIPYKNVKLYVSNEFQDVRKLCQPVRL